MEKELRRLNYIQSSKVKINPEDIPNLIPEKILNEWQKDDNNPYYKIQEIKYPIVANRINYLESFFESFISKLKARPIPGNKNGHGSFSSGSRSPTDFIMVGAKMEKKGDGTGKVYFKNYIPLKAASGSNETFIMENKSDMVHFSLVSYTKDEIMQDDNGTTINVIGSIKGERNDAVEHGLGAMDQKTNNDNGGKKDMDKKELLEKLKALKANAEITLPDIAKALDLSNQLITDKHNKALAMADSLTKLGVKDPVSEIKKLQEQAKANSTAVRNAELDKAFGVDADKKNYLRQYAEKQTGDIASDGLEKRINEIKDDPIAKQLARDRADYTTDANAVGSVERKNTAEITSGIKVDKI